MSAIADFLAARYDETEAAARAATPGPWGSYSQFGGGFVTNADGGILIYSEGTVDAPTADHIALHDPGRVLVGLRAKRELLAAWDSCCHERGSDWSFAWSVLKSTIEAEAAVYADHPDYSESWRPRTE